MKTTAAEVKQRLIDSGEDVEGLTDEDFEIIELDAKALTDEN